MNFERLDNYLVLKPGTVKTYPFGDDVSVYKVQHKMFALVGYRPWKDEKTMMLNLKCDPQESFIIRDIFSSITTGYHMSKKHWISIYFDDTVPSGEIERLIDASYALVVSHMTKTVQEALTKS